MEDDIRNLDYENEQYLKQKRCKCGNIKNSRNLCEDCELEYGNYLRDMRKDEQE